MGTDANRIGKNIQKYRRMKNISQEELGKITYTSRSTVSLWERGEKEPSEDEVRLLSEVFGVSIDSIVDGEEPAETVSVQEKIIESADTLETAQEKMKNAIDELIIQNSQHLKIEERKAKEHRIILLIVAIAIMLMIAIFWMFYCNINQPRKDGSLERGGISLETSIFLEEGGTE